MEIKEFEKLQAERTIEHLSKKIDEILDNHEKGDSMSSIDIHMIKDAWCAIHSAHEVLKMS